MPRILLLVTALLGLWWGIAVILALPSFILPTPDLVFATLFREAPNLFHHALITWGEMILGLLFGTCLAITLALFMVGYPKIKAWVFPILIGSQALPVFALAPILTLWLGFGLSSKLVMTCLIVYFPIVGNFYDGLTATRPQLIRVAQSLNATPQQILFLIRIPAALPNLATGIRIGATLAPIGAIVGEWVGAAEGLGYIMLHANGRMQTDLMFAALILVMILAFGTYGLVGFLLGHLPNLPKKIFG